MGLVIAPADPRASDLRALLGRHLAFAREVTPPEDVHALDIDGLLDPAVTVFCARLDGKLVGVGALKQLDESHGEVKSMHTVEEVRGNGIGRAMVEHLLLVARDRNYRRVSLETGSRDVFAPAHSLYAKAGFVPCEPFGEYTASPNSMCMTISFSEEPYAATQS